MKLDSYLTPYNKINSKEITELHLTGKTTKFLEHKGKSSRLWVKQSLRYDNKSTSNGKQKTKWISPKLKRCVCQRTLSAT